MRGITFLLTLCSFICYNSKARRGNYALYGGVAQLARACGSYPQCRWFKSDRRYQDFIFRVPPVS